MMSEGIRQNCEDCVETMVLSGHGRISWEIGLFFLLAH